MKNYIDQLTKTASEYGLSLSDFSKKEIADAIHDIKQEEKGFLVEDGFESLCAKKMFDKSK